MMKKAEWTRVINNIHFSVFSDEHKKSQFLALLGRGYFPRQLPPPFNTKGFEKHIYNNHEEFKTTIINALHSKGRLKTAEICQFSLARPEQLRRVLGLPNPAYHYLLSLILAEEFSNFEFDDDILFPDYSMSFPKFDNDNRNRAFEFFYDWDDIPLRRLKNRAKGRFLVKTDIARFFPSIYTHSIPWVLHSKNRAKRNRSADLVGNIIDLLVRNGQDGQTLGIPIGPDTSFLLSERILLEVDKLVYEKIKDKAICCFHWVDDYEFVCLHREDAEYCLSVLQQALQEFELELNTLKTQIVELPSPVQDTEVAHLRNFKFDEDPTPKQFLEYCDLAFDCYKKHPRGTLKYAIKRIPEFVEYSDIISDFMVQCMMLEPGVIEAVFVWLAKAGSIDHVDKEMFVECLSLVAVEHGRLRHTSEVAWAIWGFILLQRVIPDEVAQVICEMEDSVVLLLALDAREKGLISSDSLDEQVKSVLTEDSLYGQHWLLSYEAACQGWASQDHIEKNSIFNSLKCAGVHFEQADQ
jgi:hypothetical protein